MHFEIFNKEKHNGLLKKYCEECKKIGYANNSSIERLNLTAHTPSLFLVGLERKKIVLFQGCYSLRLGDTKYWRMGYRAATTIKTKALFNNHNKTPVTCGVALLMMQLSSKYDAKRFIFTTNSPLHSIDGAGKSHKMDKVLSRTPGHSLIYKNLEFKQTIQNIWKIDKNVYDKYFWNYHIHNNTFEEGLIDA